MARYDRKMTSPSLWLEGLYSNVDKYDVFGSEDNFQVKVLDIPSQVGNEIVFSGRIIDPRMAHEAFLPDPCDQTIASNPVIARAIANFHTIIIVRNAAELSETISRDDIIVAKFSPGQNENKYDLQSGDFVKIFKKNNTNSGTNNINCTSLKDLNYASGGFMGDMLTVFSPPPNGQYYSAKPASQLTDYQIPGSITPATTTRTSPYGPRRPPKTSGGGQGSSTHRGIDFSGGKRSVARNSGAATVSPTYVVANNSQHIEPCRSIFDGVVKSVTYGGVSYSAGDNLYTNNGDVKRSGYGLVVKISHNVKDVLGNDRNIISVYAHLEYTDLVAGQDIKQGDPVGHIGSTGSSTGPHLHFEIQEENLPSGATGWGAVKRNGGTLSQRTGKYWDPTWVLGWRYGSAGEHEEQDAEDVNYIEENHSEEQFDQEELSLAAQQYYGTG